MDGMIQCQLPSLVYIVGHGFFRNNLSVRGREQERVTTPSQTPSKPNGSADTGKSQHAIGPIRERDVRKISEECGGKGKGNMNGITDKCIATALGKQFM
jgi:hypothetical protein